jgi:hypothetical protein
MITVKPLALPVAIARVEREDRASNPRASLRIRLMLRPFVAATLLLLSSSQDSARLDMRAASSSVLKKPSSTIS